MNNGKIFKTDRLCGLSDGVYSIVLTLLVLDLRVPEVERGEKRLLLQDLWNEFQTFWVYLICFLIISDLWMRHHRYLSALKQCDYQLIVINFLHLLFLSLIPFTTSLSDQYDYDQIAVVIFILNLGLCGVMLAWLGHYARKNTDWHLSENNCILLVEHWLLRYGYLVIVVAGSLLTFLHSQLALGIVMVISCLMCVLRFLIVHRK